MQSTSKSPTGCRRAIASGLLLGATLCWAAQAHAGAFLLSDTFDVNAVSHPTGYTGAGGVLTVTVCIDPASPNAASMEVPIQDAIATWNGLVPTSPNLFFGTNNNIPAGDIDFESAALHEMGHCIGLHHPNLSTESGLMDPDRNYTKTTTGANSTYDLNAGADTVIGSSDDVRGDDVNLHWFRASNNNPFTIAGTVDATTYTKNVASLPAGHMFVANADRSVGALLGFPDTEAVMQQGAFTDEAQRSLNHDDVATFRLGMSGLDMTQGTADDYTINLTYGGMVTGCDINAKFDNAQSSFAQCNTSLTTISGSHYRVSTASMFFNTGFNWFFNGAPTTTTTTTTATTSTSTTSTTIAASVGHLKCYKTKDPRTKIPYTLDLLSGVGGFPNEIGCALKPASTVCVEVGKQNVSPTPPGGGPVIPANAGSVFLSYKLKCPKLTVAPIFLGDQFGAGSFAVTSPAELLVPALPGPANDHYECYKAKDVRPKASYTADLIAGVAGFTNELGCSVKLGAKRVCVQVTKQNVSPPPPGGGPGPGPGDAATKLISYKLKCPKGVVPAAGFTDQFGAGTFTPGSVKALLVPAQ